jgi:hypothetical protein
MAASTKLWFRRKTGDSQLLMWIGPPARPCFPTDNKPKCGTNTIARPLALRHRPVQPYSSIKVAATGTPAKHAQIRASSMLASAAVLRLPSPTLIWTPLIDGHAYSPRFPSFGGLARRGNRSVTVRSPEAAGSSPSSFVEGR